MSRWRQTLCGSYIKSCEPYLEAQIIRFRENAQTLTCGGSYLPQPYENPFKPRMANPTILTLPKENYEILVVDSRNEANRYGGESDWFHEMEATDPDHTSDVKLQK